MKKNENFFEDLRNELGDVFSDEELKELDGELDNKIFLNDENGNEVEFEFLDLITYRGDKYVVLLPADETDDAGEVVILMVEDTDSDDEESYTSVDDEETLNIVFDIFREKSRMRLTLLTNT